MRRREVSTRRIRPTLPEINVPLLMETLKQWRHEFEEDGCVTVFDDALVLHKPSLRCSLSEDGPEDVLEANHNRLRVNGYSATEDEKAVVDELSSALTKRGYKFSLE